MRPFLGREEATAIKQIRARSPAGWFELADDVAVFCDGLLPTISPSLENGQEVLSAVLYRRVMSAFEAVLLLAERGLHTEGLVVRRAMLEALFVLRAIWQHPDLVRTYVLNDLHRRRDIYKNLLKRSTESRSRVSQWITDDELNRQIKALATETKGVTYLGVEGYAQRAKLHDLYLTDYCILSEAAHHVAKDLERQLHVDSDDNIAAVIWGPEPVPPVKLLFPAIDQMLMATYAVTKLFTLDVKGLLDALSGRCRTLAEAETGDDG